MKTKVRVFLAVCLFVGLGSATARARADAGLVVETPTGILGFLSDVGHSSIWISHGCLSKEGEVRFCENSAGIVLTSTAYWPNPGVAAIPAELFFLGARPGVNGRNEGAWNESLAATYPNVDPRSGRKYLGRVWRRGMRVTTFRTTAEQDRRVLEEVEQQRRAYSYSYSRRNCAFYAQMVLKLYLGEEFHANRSMDLGIDTPRALERSLIRRLEADAQADVHVFSFKGTLLQSWREPPRTFCESAVLDPKYAIPLLLFQPYVYAGFGVCYGVSRLTAVRWAHHRHPAGEILAFQPERWSDAATVKADPRLTTYQALAGTFPASSQWISATETPRVARNEEIHGTSSPSAF